MRNLLIVIICRILHPQMAILKKIEGVHRDCIFSSKKQLQPLDCKGLR